MYTSYMYRLWGKTDPYNSLICHMIDVGCMAQELLANSCFEEMRSKLAWQMGINEQEVLEWIGFIFALHDIGKCHPDFQGKIDNNPLNDELRTKKLMKESTTSFGVREYRHESYVWECSFDYLEKKCVVPIEMVRIFLDVMSLHHWRYDKAIEIEKHYREFWQEIQLELADTLKFLFVTTAFKGRKVEHRDVFSTLLEGLLILSDWIASNHELMPFAENTITDAESYYNQSKMKAQKAIKKLGFRSRNISAFGKGFLDVWPDIKEKGFQPRPIQALCEELIKEKLLLPKLLIIEAPMGEGKTEAAIYTAVQWMQESNAKGFYMALPTSATSNQMYGRIQDFFIINNINDAHIKLIHGLAWLLDDETPEKTAEGNVVEDSEERALAYEWFQPARRSLLVPFGIGTIDQAMMAALFVKFGVLRLLGLSNKVLIIDEIHAYDVFMSTIIERLLNWCGALEIPVIMLSATLPQTKKLQLVKAYGGKVAENQEISQVYPSLTWLNARDEFIEQEVVGPSITKDVILKLEYGMLGNWEEVATNAIDDTKNGGCLCIILNTVQEAQKLYECLRHKASCEVEILLFHARYCVEDRNRIERNCLSRFDKSSLLSKDHLEYHHRPQRAILVATQVVEQSLDLDFDIMYSSIAPIDLLLQRVGRLHRHNRPLRVNGREAVFHILLPAQDLSFGATGKVYDEFILSRTVECLESWGGVIHIPQDLKPMVEKVYKDNIDNLDEREQTLLLKMQKKINEERKEGKEHLISAPDSRKFGIAKQMGQASVQQEDGTLGYFRAQTRLGNQTESFLLLEETQWLSLKENMKVINKTQAKKIFQKMVSLPVWWLQEVIAAEGYYLPQTIEKGMAKSNQVLIMKGGVWKGLDKNRKTIIICKNEEMGILRKGCDE